MQRKFNANEVPSALRFIRDSLEGFKLSQKDSMRAELFCEEALLRLIKYSDFSVTNYFRVIVYKSFGNIMIDISVPGSGFDFAGSLDFPDNDEFFSGESQEAIQNLLLRLFMDSERIKFRHSGKFNTITITALTSSYEGLYKVLAALALALTVGVSMRAFLPNELCTMINANFFSVISAIFANGLKMCAVPIVFFSIVLCFADMGNMRGLKRAGTKLFTWFIVLQVVAVAIGFVFVILFGTGRGTVLSLTSGFNGVQNFAVNFRGTIANLMPANLIRPFLEGDMLGLIILAVLTGAAAGLLGAKSILSCCNELNAIFMSITDLLLKIIPLVVFCSVSSMIITAGFNTIISLLGVLFTILAAFAVMHIIYYLLIKFVAGLNPSIMYRKFTNTIITAFSTCSSNAAIPDALAAAGKLGLSQKFYPFAVPLGILINKHGLCIYMAVVILSAANMYGLSITLTQLISTGISIIILVLVSPGIAGAGPAALSIIFTQLKLPLDLLGPIMAISAIEDMFDDPTNCIGNITSTLIVARSENLLDLDEYNRI